MTDYTGTGQKENDPILTNLRCINPGCKLSLSPKKSQYIKLDFRCYACNTLQHGLWYDCGHVHKNITEALECKKPELVEEVSIQLKKIEYEEYLASYWGKIAPLSYKNWKLVKNPSMGEKDKSTNPKDQIGITKLPLHLIPAPALARLSKAMEVGAEEYGPYNWRETGVNLTVYISAALRHIFSILDGEDTDVKSGQPHAAHAMACMAIILDAIEVGKLIDDRPTPGNFAQLVTLLQEKK